MPDAPSDVPAVSAEPTAPAATRPHHLPAVFRWLVAAILGVAVAGLASYLMRSIGF